MSDFEQSEHEDDYQDELEQGESGESPSAEDSDTDDEFADVPPNGDVLFVKSALVSCWINLTRLPIAWDCSRFLVI